MYLKSLTLDRFKSFAHAELLFSRGFTCVVGPNGSGKSNICDALLFGLGESSMRRLRSDKGRLDNLISYSKKNTNKLRTAYVKIAFDGDEQLLVTRAVRSDGKSLYKINGKRMTRQEALEVLGKHGMRADETNTIAQGEINQFMQLNSKERRELIDMAAGIKEFELKKNEAMKELEKVGQKINEAQIMLHERQGFLNELSAEKESAEKHIALSSKLKVLNYSMLSAKKKEADQFYAEYTSKMAIIDSTEKETANKMDESKRRTEQLSTERTNLTKELNESTQMTGETNARLEAIKIELTAMTVELNNSFNSITESDRTIIEFQSELKTMQDKMIDNLNEFSKIKAEFEEKEERLRLINAEEENKNTDYKNLKEINDKLTALEEKAVDSQNYISALQRDLSLLASQKEQRAKENQAFSKQISEKKEIRSKQENSTKGLGTKKDDLISKEMQNVRKISSLNAGLEKIDGSLIRLMEQRAVSQSRGLAVYETIKSKFGKESGFFGRASELCKYSVDGAIAIETAAGNRLEYVVVDSMKTASTIIEYLKQNSLGRMTFIPINELNTESDTGKERGATNIIEMVEFEPKFKKVFSYVFNNTYLIDNALDAKKIGIGKHRYVTKEGELVEQSGIMSGGSQSKRPSLTMIENQLRELNERKEELKAELEARNTELFNYRKERALLDMGTKSTTDTLLQLGNEIESFEVSLKSGLSELSSIEAKTDSIKKELEKADSEKMGIITALNMQKERLNTIYGERIIKEDSSGKNEQYKETVTNLRGEVEKARIRRAEIQKENDLLEQRKKETNTKISERQKLVKKTKEAMKDIEIRRAVLEKSKKELEKQIMGVSDAAKKLYSRLNSIDSEIGKASTEYGRLTAEHSNIERQLNEHKFKRAQVETRISDLAAELSTYKEEIKALEMPIPELEKESNVISARITELGNVNLKAPEIYDEKRKSVEEANSKLETLDAERQAIMRMVEEIDSKKLQTFMGTLNDVAGNFSRLYNLIFPGSASMKLENPKEPFNSGLDISITDGKTSKTFGAMSGGQKSFISLIMIFAIHLCKPSAVYIFDEVDVALDKDNSKKLSQLIKEMSKNAQFIVVSHNDSLITNSDTAVGVVMKNGESKAVGLDVSSIVSSKSEAAVSN